MSPSSAGILKQSKLLVLLRSLFPAEKILENVKKKSALRYSTGSYMELDLWLPKLRLGFEFQDPYHYVTTWFSHKAIETIKAKDNMKREMAHQMGINFIVIPCWWDGRMESLVATIQFQIPDILLPINEIVDSIPLNPSFGFFRNAELPNVGELMLASFPTQFQFDQESISNNWWMGEKYDGIRFCWNSAENNMNPLSYSRHGKLISVLPKLQSNIPSLFIDGEFWFGRGEYIYTYSLFMGSLDLVKWDILRMVVFDIPSYDVHQMPFEKRYEQLLSNAKNVAPRIEIQNKHHLSVAVQGVIDDGGEGIILRKKNSLYEHGRTPNLLKLKTAQGDKEGMVTHIGDNNSVYLKLADGRNIEVPPENVLIATPLVGDIVSFSFESHARRELPQNPKIYKRRIDLSWNDVISNFIKDHKFLNETSKISEGFKTQPIGHWTKKNMQLFLETFARSRKMDPRSPETWYNIPLAAIRSSKIGRVILKKLKGGFYRTLRFLFPGLDLEKKWLNKREKRRRVMEHYARQKGFDPTIPSFWYSQSKQLLLFYSMGTRRVMQWYNNSVADALIDLFPNIGLEKSKFPGHATMVSHNRREYFENLARMNGLDSLSPSNWYSFPRQVILSSPGIRKILSHHEYSIAKALTELFPEIGLDISRINSSWDTIESRRKFFEDFAQAYNFSPLRPDNWYFQPRKRILQFQGAPEVLMYHDNSITTALMDLFPNIGLDKQKLQSLAVWPIEKRRNFFIEFAKTNQFDPFHPQNWYSVSKDPIIATNYGNLVLSNYNNSLSTALLDLFPNIGLDKSEFQQPALWKDYNSRRKFFENVALENGFNFSNPNDWYSCSKESIMSVKGSHAVIMYHNYSISQALLDLFPNIGLDKSRLVHFGKAFMSEPSNRKAFFERYASDNGFDPLIPDHWYSQSKGLISSTKGCRDVLLHHKNSLATALLTLFPDIGLQKTKLRATNWK